MRDSVISLCLSQSSQSETPRIRKIRSFLNASKRRPFFFASLLHPSIHSRWISLSLHYTVQISRVIHVSLILLPTYLLLFLTSCLPPWLGTLPQSMHAIANSLLPSNGYHLFLPAFVVWHSTASGFRLSGFLTSIRIRVSGRPWMIATSHKIVRMRRGCSNLLLNSDKKYSVALCEFQPGFRKGRDGMGWDISIRHAWQSHVWSVNVFHIPFPYLFKCWVKFD